MKASAKLLLSRRVSDEQAAMIADAMRAQHAMITHALATLATKLTFDAPKKRPKSAPDVLRVRRSGKRMFMFVGLSKGYAEPPQDTRHQNDVRHWLGRFARQVNKRRGKGGPHLAGGYVIVGAHDEPTAYAWASLLTTIARAHHLHRDGEPARFVVRRLDSFWMAC